MSDLQEAIHQNLVNSMSHDKLTRDGAEQQLKMLETKEEFGILLMQISLQEGLDFSIRHLASVLLDQYICRHWQADGNQRFEPPEVQYPYKVLIRNFLLKALNMESSADEEGGNSKDAEIRRQLNAYAHAISRIARYDWPSDYQDLLPTLVGYIDSGEPRVAASALKVFKELSNEICDLNIPDFAPILLPNMLGILQSPNFLARTKANAVKVFSSVAETIMCMNEVEPAAIKMYLAPHLDRFATLAIELLMVPVDCNIDAGGGGGGSNLVDIGLKKDLIIALTKFIRNCRSYIKAHLQRIMQLVWESLITSAHTYVGQIVNSNSSNADLELYTDAVDSDGESIDFESYIFAMLDFVAAILESSKCRDLIKPVLTELIYYILCYIQLTDSQINSWLDDVECFLGEDDIQSGGAYSIRIVSQELITDLATNMASNEKGVKKDDELFKLAFVQAVNRHFAEGRAAEKTRKHGWWKPIEACLYVVGLLSRPIIYTVRSVAQQALAREYQTILDSVVANIDLNEPFLAGRSVWSASRFAAIMNDQSLDNFFKLTSNLLTMPDTDKQQPVLRIFALRATHYFGTSVTINMKVDLIKPYLAQLMQGMLASAVDAKSELLDLCLITIKTLLKLDKDFTITTTASACALAVAAFLKFPADPVLFGSIQDVLDVLFLLGECAPQLHQHLLPIVLAILDGNKDMLVAASAMATGFGKKEHILKESEDRGVLIQQLQPLALEILTEWIKNSPCEPSDVMIQQAYPALLRCLLGASNDESSILQNATECIKAFVAKGSAQLSAWIDPATNQNGITLAIEVCNKLLQPSVSDSCSAYVGQLVCSLIVKAPQSINQETFHYLLRSTLVKLASVREALITEGLVLVFAHLIFMELSNTLMFLNSIPAPVGTKSALSFVIDRWLSVQRLYYGYDNKASTVALCRLFQFSLRSNPHAQVKDCELGINLHQVEVSREDLLSELEGGVASRTRARTTEANKGKENVQVMTPATVKILKSLLNELRHIDELKNSEDEDDDDENGDEQKSEDDEEDYVHGFDLEDEELLYGESNLPETVLSTEIARFELEDVLTGVLREFTQVPWASEMSKYLTEAEKQLLKRIAS